MSENSYLFLCELRGSQFLPQGQTVNATLYIDVLEKLRKGSYTYEKMLQLPGYCITIMHPGHTSLHVREFLAKHYGLTLPQPPYSPDITPADFLLFQKINTALKGQNCDNIEAIQAAVTMLRLKRCSRQSLPKGVD
jgi:hypothetical protein